MKVISRGRYPGAWVKAIVQGRWVEAKIFEEPSYYGINEGRISKLAISGSESKFSETVYNYDRGLYFSEIDEDLLNSIVEELENEL